MGPKLYLNHLWVQFVSTFNPVIYLPYIWRTCNNFVLVAIVEVMMTVQIINLVLRCVVKFTSLTWIIYRGIRLCNSLPRWCFEPTMLTAFKETPFKYCQPLRDQVPYDFISQLTHCIKEIRLRITTLICVDNALAMSVIFSSYCRRSVHPERPRSYSWRISAISLKFDGMMHSTMGPIAVQNGYTRPIFVWSTELWIFPW